MNKSVILSVNDNPDYLYYAPICCMAWKYFGWNPCLFFVLDKENELTDFVSKKLIEEGSTSIINLKTEQGFRSDTTTQVSRLHGYFFSKEDYLLIGDIDMIPLKDIWTRDFDSVNVFGHDLTGFGHIPMCYIGAPGEEFAKIFQNGGKDPKEAIKIDLESYSKAKSEVFDEYWYTDQEIATKKIKATEGVKYHNRTQYKNGFALGRVDRGSWTLEHPEFIDSHLMRNAYKDQDSFKKNKALYELIFKDYLDWVSEYTEEYRTIWKKIYS